jgi:hypothetical protein
MQSARIQGRLPRHLNYIQLVVAHSLCLWAFQSESRLNNLLSAGGKAIHDFIGCWGAAVQSWLGAKGGK